MFHFNYFFLVIFHCTIKREYLSNLKKEANIVHQYVVLCLPYLDYRVKGLIMRGGGRGSVMHEAMRGEG